MARKIITKSDFTSLAQTPVGVYRTMRGSERYLKLVMDTG